MRKIWIYIIKTWNWLLKKNKLGIANVASMAFVLLIIFGSLMNCFYEYTFLARSLAKVAVAGVIIIIFMGLFESDDKIVKFLSRSKYSTPKELLKRFSHKSYIFGLLYWTICVSCFLYGIILVFIEIKIDNNIFFIVNGMIYTFLWFTYHIYVNSEIDSVNERNRVIKLRLQLYGAIMSSLSAVFLIIEAYSIFKTMISMLAITYTWLNYLIEKDNVRREISEYDNIIDKCK